MPFRQAGGGVLEGRKIQKSQDRIVRKTIENG